MVDVWSIYYEETDQKIDSVRALNATYSSLYAVIDFTSQMALIYRCWIIWNQNYFVAIFPAIVSLSSMACDFALLALPLANGAFKTPINLRLDLGRYAFSASLAVNLFVMSLIIIRIWRISRQITEVGWKTGRTYNIVIAMILESGVPILLGQLIWLTLFATGNAGFDVVAGAITQLYGITPAILMIRVTLGDSYDGFAKPKLNTSTSLVFERQARSQYEVHAFFLAERSSSSQTGQETIHGSDKMAF
ncbi:hypothetical protein M422DRAFT_257476 [Sphaerobolus stellatus SS14]|uniref:Uncharacterized protein n=1 Tax=Sphaerobolus stellatus (strain SS14) TaxID=990650 RepID=A0A0C9U996_SPHS4|nr:hypothetical protein M422DRAFT_257476 [Sphaerobolus stellatus SS14]